MDYNGEVHENGQGPDDSDIIEAFEPRLNLLNPSFITRCRLYLKPGDGSLPLQISLLLVDTTLAITYVVLQFFYVIDGNYEDEQDKLLQLMIGFGVTGAILTYCIADAIRFLSSWLDRFLYILSCLL